MFLYIIKFVSKYRGSQGQPGPYIWPLYIRAGPERPGKAHGQSKIPVSKGYSNPHSVWVTKTLLRFKLQV